MDITIIPGSFKPPHIGHLSLVEKLIKKGNNSKIILIISKKERPLDERFLYMEQKNKVDLQNALIEYFPQDDEIILLTKDKLIKKIKELIKIGKIPSINAEQSYKIWSIYLKYLKKIYGKTLPKIIFRVSLNNNIMLESDKVVLESFKEKPRTVILMKSKKNALNTRFQFLERKFTKYIKTELFPDIKDIDATGMRNSILENNKNNFLKYLPTDLDIKDKNKTWKIAKK